MTQTDAGKLADAKTVVSAYVRDWQRIIWDATGDQTKVDRITELAELNGLFDPVAATALRTPPIGNAMRAALELVRSAYYANPTGTAENAWNDACQHIEEGLLAAQPQEQREDVQPVAFDRDVARAAAETANKLYKQWMPQQWLLLFMDAYEDIAACRAAPPPLPVAWQRIIKDCALAAASVWTGNDYALKNQVVDAILACKPPPLPDSAGADGVRWQRVNSEPFEYAIQQGQFGDEFVKLLNGTCLRRAISPHSGKSRLSDEG